MANTQSIINDMGNDIQSLIKKDIKTKGLVDSGKLLKSIKVIPKMVGDRFSFEIEAEDYFVYLNDTYHIMDDVMNSSEFDKIMEDGLFKIVESSIDEQIKN